MEPYNAMLCASSLLEHASVSLIFDNEKLYEVCSQSMRIARPSFGDTNRYVSFGRFESSTFRFCILKAASAD